MQEDRQREIAAENLSLMNRLAGIMREDRVELIPRYTHLSAEYRETLRRKKLLKLEVRVAFRSRRWGRGRSSWCTPTGKCRQV